MKNKFVTVFITSCLISGVALADDDCTDPVADWQPKDRVRQMMTEYGWDVKRIKVDDGCYEVKGLDRKGHEVEAKVSPASLKLLQLEIRFQDSKDISDYLNNQDDSAQAGSAIGPELSTTANKHRDTFETEAGR